MSRKFGLASVLALCCIVAPAAWAEDSGATEELRVLRAVVEKQSKQIEQLTDQVAKLRIALERNGDVSLGAAATAPVPAPATPPPAATVEFSPDAPKAEPADGKRHVVIKGETLTSIAKQYSITLAELKKANKDVDERKLQIGQTLTIPTPKAGDPPPAKKED